MLWFGQEKISLQLWKNAFARPDGHNYVGQSHFPWDEFVKKGYGRVPKAFDSSQSSRKCPGLYSASEGAGATNGFSATDSATDTTTFAIKAQSAI
jgi:hypothetical protein